jgi:UrcA family protein
VSYGDLDLNTHAGVATMYARLEAAAKRACSADEGPRSDGVAAPCVDRAVRQAVARIGAPRLVVLYETRSGHFLPRARGNASFL